MFYLLQQRLYPGFLCLLLYLTLSCYLLLNFFILPLLYSFRKKCGTIETVCTIVLAVETISKT